LALAPGTLLGPYEIVLAIGAGGMGDVYRARDTRLGRDVAIKVLPDTVASDMDRRARFERETKAVAALSHPNVLAIFDTGVHEGQLFAVTELLNGQTLRDRLAANGAMSPRKVIEIAVPIARGLAAAHAKGLVHRDLKPENVFLLEDGQVKILDFGLVRQMGAEVASGATKTFAGTNAGVVMGTIGYMAPEQVVGQTVDARADIFALGAVLYEMLSARRAYQGATAADSLTAILNYDPPDLAGIVTDLPPALDRIVRHCLEKNPAERFQSTRDVAFALESLSGSGPVSSGPSSIPIRSRRPSAPWIAGSVVGLGLLAAGWFGGRALVPSTAPTTATWVSLPAPHGRFAGFPAPAISPDGTQVAFWAPDERGRVMLWNRRFDVPDARALPGTEIDGDPYQAFWAPDGRALAYFADGKLKRVGLDGGAPQPLADAMHPRGGSWSRDGRILFLPVGGGPVYSIPQSGGTPTVVPITDPEHRPLLYPSLLPDGRHFLTSSPNGGVFLCNLDDPAIRKVSDVRSRVEYSAGYLFFEQDGGLFAQAFDISRFEVSGAPVRVSDGIGYGSGFGSPIDRAFSVSSTGRLVYTQGTWQPLMQLTWLDRSGQLGERFNQVGESLGVVVSHDQMRALVERHDPKTNLTGPWIVDFVAATQARIASNQLAPIELTPLLSSDETRVFFSTPGGIFSRELRGGQVTPVLAQNSAVWLDDRSTDGKFLVFEKGDPVTQEDIWVLTLGSTPTARPFLATNYTEGQAVLSPDGHAIAYVSDESGRAEVYVDSFPEPQTKRLVSVGGGVRPEWRPDGRELYYLGSERALMATSVEATAPIKVGRPIKLFQMVPVGWNVNRHQYQPSATGDRFLVNARVPTDGDSPLTVLLNWPAVLGK